MQESSFPTYDDIQYILTNADSELNPSELHGLMCGLVCAGQALAWKSVVYGQQHTRCDDELIQLQGLSEQSLANFSLEFNLVLPTDEASLAERTEALGFWCQGLLLGLKQGQASFENVSAECLEAWQDLQEIAQIDYEQSASTDEDEMAFIEVVEHVRLAILLLYQELSVVTQASVIKH